MYYKVRSIVRGLFWGGLLTATLFGMGVLYMTLTGGVY